MADPLSSDLASLKIAREEKQPSRRGLRVSLVLVLLVGGGVAAYLVGAPLLKAKVFKPEVALTEVALISPVQESVRLTATGYVVPQLLSKVSPKIQGRLARVLIKEGDKVTAGSPLFQIEDTDVRARLAAAQQRVLAARASVEAARANLAEIRQQAERQKILTQRGAAARAVSDDLAARATSLQVTVQAAEAQVKVAQADVETERVNLGYVQVRAPIGGVVISKPPPIGDLVGPGLGAIVELADFSSLVVETDIPESRLHMVQKGAPCEIVLDAFPMVRHRGEVSELGQRINRAKATSVVKVKFLDSIEGVLPEMAARVNVLAKALDERSMKEPPKVVVPSAAVVERAGGKVVFVYEEGKVRMTPVVLGPVFGNGYELRSGPSAGTRLVKGPSQELADGASVKERNDG